MSELLESNEELKKEEKINNESEMKKENDKESDKESDNEDDKNNKKEEDTFEGLNKKSSSPTITTIIERTVEYVLRKIIFWENTDERVGIVIRFFHNVFFYSLLMVYIINHTIFPSYFLFVGVYIIGLIIWLQHLFCGECIIHLIERRLLNDKKGVLSPLMELFGIKSDEYNSKILLMFSTHCIVMLSFELITRTIFLFKNWLF